MKKMSFLVNPPRGAKRAHKKRRRTNAPASRARKRKARAHNPPARRHNVRGPAMATKKRRRRKNPTGTAVVRRNRPRKSSRRRRRINPAFGIRARGILGGAVQGAKDGAAVLSGEFIAGLAETKIPGMTPGTTQAAAVATVATVVVGTLAQKFVGKRAGEMVIAGAVAKFGRRIVKAQFATNATVQSALGEYGFPLVTAGGFGSYTPRDAVAAAAVGSNNGYPY